jgi:FtsH-binding integral membrane protein
MGMLTHLAFEFLGPIIFGLLMAVVFGAGEYVLYRTGRRFWMWALGLAGIGLLVWIKGADQPWSYLLAVGWLLVLVYLDRRRSYEPAEGQTASQTDRASVLSDDVRRS